MQLISASRKSHLGREHLVGDVGGEGLGGRGGGAFTPAGFCFTPGPLFVAKDAVFGGGGLLTSVTGGGGGREGG